MNLIIIETDTCVPGQRILLSARQHKHIQAVLKTQPGQELTVGHLNGQIGKARIRSITGSTTEVEVLYLDAPSPPTLPVKLILGLPRPQMLQRILQTVATMGIAELHLLQTSRVEKSFWQTPLLKPEAVREQLILGLEQAKATQLPPIFEHRRFRPFVEDTLPHIVAETQHQVIAHPGDYPEASPLPAGGTCLVIGPEGGLLPQEVEQFATAGFKPVQLGERILKVETAVPVLLGRLF